MSDIRAMDNEELYSWLHAHKKTDLMRLQEQIAIVLRSKSDPIDIIVNRCVCCGVDMGSTNPRQYCRKSYCENEPDEYFYMGFNRARSSSDNSTDSSLLESL